MAYLDQKVVLNMSRLEKSIIKRLLPDLWVLISLVLAPVILPHLGFSQDVMNRILVYGLLGIGFDLLFGYTGLLSFGQAAFFGTGGFVTAYLLTNSFTSSIALALIAGVVVSAIVGFLVGLVALRRTGIYFAMITVAIGEVFYFLENSPLANYTGGENGLPGVPSPNFSIGNFVFQANQGWNMYIFLAICFLIGIVIARRIIHSPVGHILVAIRDNPLRAAAVGHRIQSYKQLIFVIAACYAGFAGGLLGILQGYMPPDAFSFDTSGQLVMQTVIGGVGTLLGPMVGASIWLYLRDFFQSTLGLGASWKLALGLVFMLLVIFLRKGVIGGFVDLNHLLHHKRKKHLESDPNPDTEVTLESLVSEIKPSKIHDINDIVLEVKGLSKRYGGLLANSDINFSVHRGELRGIIGPNGAGKSTFFKMLTCEVHPTSGSIKFEGRDITGFSVTDVCQLGLTKSYQVNQLFNQLTVTENVLIAILAKEQGSFKPDLFHNASHDKRLHDMVDHTLSLVHLTNRKNHPVSELAYGEKRRLEIGLALATSPSLLLLDEPLAGMSPKERVETVRLLKAIGEDRTLIVIDHDMDAIFELAEKITVLREGKILVEGTPAEIRNNAQVQEAYLGGMEE